MKDTDLLTSTMTRYRHRNFFYNLRNMLCTIRIFQMVTNKISQSEIRYEKSKYLYPDN